MPLNDLQRLEQQGPFVPSYYDQMQLAFGVDNPRTRALRILRQQSTPAPTQVAPGGGGGSFLPGIGGLGLPSLTDIGSQFDAGRQYLINRFNQLRQEYNPTDNKVQRAEEAAGVGQRRVTPADLKKIQ